MFKDYNGDRDIHLHQGMKFRVAPRHVDLQRDDVGGSLFKSA